MNGCSPGKRKAERILTNVANATDLSWMQNVVRWYLILPIALPLNMKQKAAKTAAQKSTWIVLVFDARFCHHCGQSLYLKISTDGDGRLSYFELAVYSVSCKIYDITETPILAGNLG